MEIGTEAGNPKGANVVMLAALVTKTGIVSDKNALEALAYSFKAKPKLIDINVKLYEYAKEYIKKNMQI
jgi:Pyruvate/2-oxoacid:ferredoxin oxidoreductase gamma subunit